MLLGADLAGSQRAVGLVLQGLGELYEQEYMQAATGFADDKVRSLPRHHVEAACRFAKVVHQTCNHLIIDLPPGLSLQDDEVRQAARAQFSALCAKLDALSHLHFT